MRTFAVVLYWPHAVAPVDDKQSFQFSACSFDSFGWRKQWCCCCCLHSQIQKADLNPNGSRTLVKWELATALIWVSKYIILFVLSFSLIYNSAAFSYQAVFYLCIVLSLVNFLLTALLFHNSLIKKVSPLERRTALINPD